MATKPRTKSQAVRKPERSDTDIVHVSYRLSEKTHKKLRTYCAVHGLSQNDFVSEAIEQSLSNVDARMRSFLASI